MPQLKFSFFRNTQIAIESSVFSFTSNKFINITKSGKCTLTPLKTRTDVNKFPDRSTWQVSELEFASALLLIFFGRFFFKDARLFLKSFDTNTWLAKEHGFCFKSVSECFHLVSPNILYCDKHWKIC